MPLYAIADLHLAISAPEKDMKVFGAVWDQYMNRLEEHWREVVRPDDLVLVAGDICWALKLNQALQDLEWLARLPGKKLLLRGNHDYWWDTATKMRKVLPPSIEILQNDGWRWGPVTIVGSRLWDDDQLQFLPWIQPSGPKEWNPKQDPSELEEQRKRYQKELDRLQISCSALPADAPVRIAMCHYPPIGPSGEPSRASALLSSYGVQMVVFGHLHSLKPDFPRRWTVEGTQYLYVAADAVDFTPVHLGDWEGGALERLTPKTS